MEGEHRLEEHLFIIWITEEGMEDSSGFCVAVSAGRRWSNGKGGWERFFF